MLYVDCFRGIAGDMFVGALIDAGADGAKIREALSGIAKISVRKTLKAGAPATRFKVSYPQKKEEYPALVGKVRGLSLAKKTEDCALAILGKLAAAEAKVHGVALPDVHLHEAADSVVDAVAGAMALEDLHLLGGQVRASTVSVGALAQATSEILSSHSIPIRYASPEEITTPTGAAILAALATSFGDEPCLKGCEGFGAGEKDFAYPNVVRVLVGEPWRNLNQTKPEFDDVRSIAVRHRQAARDVVRRIR